MEALEIQTVFTLTLWGFTIPITETVVVSWGVMVILVLGSLVLRGRMREVPRGFQAVIEAGVEMLNGFALKQFGRRWARFLGPYLGTLFLYLLLSNMIGVISPIEVKFFGREFTPPFAIRPPTRDINVTASLACVTVFLTILCGIVGKGPGGWLKHFLSPMPVMLPFNIMEIGTRLLSLCLRLFGNILGAFILMHLIEGLIPLGVPMVFALYFDFFDGLMQAGIFVFLTSIYISDALEPRLEEV